MRALAAALELRDDGTGQHAERVASLALAITKRVAPHLAEDLELEYGFLLHDIGKIGIPDTILLKPGPLTDDERLTMQEHPRLGERIIAGVRHLDGTAREIVICHHERWDGSGYPLGLAGEGIPLGARIFAIADAFDAMTNDRPYRPARSRQEAFAEIMAEAGPVRSGPGALVRRGFRVTPTADGAVLVVAACPVRSYPQIKRGPVAQLVRAADS